LPFDLGVDGLFTDFVDTGVEVRDASSNAGIDSSWLGHCKHHRHERENADYDYHPAR
jgi:hypothetical protein